MVRDGIHVVCMFACLSVCLLSVSGIRSRSLRIGLRVCSERLKKVVPRGVTGPFWEAWGPDRNLIGETDLSSRDSCDLLPGDGVRKSCRNSHFHESVFCPKGVKNGGPRELFFPYFLFCVQIQDTLWLIHPTLTGLSCCDCKDE